MKAGQGFAREVTLSNLHLFAALLSAQVATAQKGATATEEAADQSSDMANLNIASDQEIAAAEEQFTGKPIRTGVHFSRPATRRPKPVSPPPERGGDGQSSPRSDSEEVLLMRVRPRRNGRQLQLSMIVHQASFINRAKQIISAADGSVRPIDYNRVRKGKANTARFEAPELEGLSNPVARFKWVNVNSRGGTTRRVLQYEIFDADTNPTGKMVFQKLASGIAKNPKMNLRELGREKTVISKSDPKIAQWYRLA